jgi:sigma-B regulation protein RsbU (phosphoserine phosphatase)
MGLGIQSGSAYSSLDRTFERGDILLLYTDGLTEAMNKQQEQFGIERLQEFLRSSRSSPRETCSQLISELEKFAGAKTFQDDVSLVCIQFS